MFSFKIYGITSYERDIWHYLLELQYTEGMRGEAVEKFQLAHFYFLIKIQHRNGSCFSINVMES
jgi:hypothetical protein